MDKWNRLTQENKLVIIYIAKFDEYLIRCVPLSLSLSNKPYLGLGQVLGMINRELIARDITTLEQAYQLVTDLDESRGSYFH